MINAADTSMFGRIAELVTRRTGILTTRAQTDLARVTQQLIEGAGLRDLGELERRLTAGGLWEELLDQVTVRETYFFRDPQQFELIRNVILPELQEARHPLRRLRVWSAGCASGEELYSVAILLHERGLLEDSLLIGTDISERALATARAGRYREWSFRAIDPALVPLYFRREQQDYVASDVLRKHVTFQCANLLTDQSDPAEDPGQFDLILCRNVLIYFDAESSARLEKRLYDALAPGGWLLTGPSDPLLGQVAPFEVVVRESGVCYRRKLAPVFTAPPSKRREARRSQPAEPAAPILAAPPIATLDSLHSQTAAAYERADYARAIALAQALPDDVSLAVLEVRATWNAAGASQAERACERALRRHAMSAELHYLHAMILMELRRLSDALRAIRRALYLDRTLVIAHFAHGTILERVHDLEGARRAYRNTYDGCKQRAPDDPVALGDGIVAEGLCKAAAYALKELARRCPV
jgi:chemotaxis protein methyltransferase CheR